MAFYVASLYYIVKFLEEMPAPTRGTWIKLAICMGILMSIRVGGLIVFAYLLLFTGILFLWNVYKKNHGFDGKNIWLYIKKLFAPIALAYFVGVIFWTAAIQDPLDCFCGSSGVYSTERACVCYVEYPQLCKFG